MSELIAVRFKKAGKIYAIDSKNNAVVVGDKVVCETQRGLEMAEVVATDELRTKIDHDQSTRFMRTASADDIAKYENNLKNKKNVLDTTNRLVEKYKLDMRLVDVDFTLDNSKAIISFTCEDRVDFRELVKELASALKRRIELRQIGIRDQAKIVGGLGSCGKETCCKQYLNDFDKVSIKMAKNQNLSLNPTKISGICGRLMCCLAYENDYYTEVNKRMPKYNSFVQTKDGEGQVIYNNLVKQTVTVKFVNDADIKTADYTLDEITILEKNKPNCEGCKKDVKRK